MAKRMLDSPDYTLTTGGFWRFIWSIITREPSFSNWLIVDRRNHTEFRLTVEEQEAMSNFAEHSGAWMLSPDFRSLSFQQKNNYEMTQPCSEPGRFFFHSNESKRNDFDRLRLRRVKQRVPLVRSTIVRIATCLPPTPGRNHLLRS